VTRRPSFVDAAFSAHPLPGTAVGEVAGRLIDNNSARPDVLFVFVTTPFAGILEDIAPALRRLVSPTVLIGCAAHQVISPDGWLVDDPAITALAVNTGEVDAARYEPGRLPVAVDGATTVTFADPYSAQISLLSDLSGGYASSGSGPGGNRLVLDGHIHTDGCVAVTFPAGHGVRACRGPDTLERTQWRAARGLLAFSEAAGEYWHQAVLGDGEMEPEEEETPPVLSGFVSNLTFPAPLTAFGVESGHEQGTQPFRDR
jgi:hypothetical protein